MKRKHECRHNLVNTNVNGTRGHASAYSLRSLACEWMHATELGKGLVTWREKALQETLLPAGRRLLFMRVVTYRATGERSRKPGAIVWGRIARTFEALTLTCWLCLLVESFADQQGLVLVDVFSPMPSLMPKKPQKGSVTSVFVFKLRTRKLTLISYFDGCHWRSRRW